MPKVKITVYETRPLGAGRPREFIVLKTVNTTDPAVDSSMSEDDLAAVLAAGGSYNVIPKPTR